jgi:hypothetical protein
MYVAGFELMVGRAFWEPPCARFAGPRPRIRTSGRGSCVICSLRAADLQLAMAETLLVAAHYLWTETATISSASHASRA